VKVSPEGKVNTWNAMREKNSEITKLFQSAIRPQTPHAGQGQSAIRRSCAIFDLDGTIINNSSERTFVRYLLSKCEISLANLLGWTGYLLKTRDLRAAKANKVYLRGKEYEKICSLAHECFRELLIDHISPKAMDVIQFHKESGRMVILLSGSLKILVNCFKDYISADLAVGYCLEVIDGIITGRITGLHPYEKNKAILLKRLATEYNLDLSSSYAYGNRFSDVYKLNLTKYPIAVNPDRKLRRIAIKKGWQIENFH